MFVIASEGLMPVSELLDIEIFRDVANARQGVSAALATKIFLIMFLS